MFKGGFVCVFVVCLWLFCWWFGVFALLDVGFDAFVVFVVGLVVCGCLFGFGG